ncbi:MAG: hypothetical protein WDO56_20365 [Gammaproteobacteria bacterium]
MPAPETGPPSRSGSCATPLLDTILAVNVNGPALIVSEAFYGNVKSSKLKKIVAISSSNGTLTGEKTIRPGLMFYRASKAALNGRCRSWPRP